MLRGEIWQLSCGALKKRAQNVDAWYHFLGSYFEGKTSIATTEIERVRCGHRPTQTRNGADAYDFMYIQDLVRSIPEHPFYQSEPGVAALRNGMYKCNNP